MTSAQTGRQNPDHELLETDAGGTCCHGDETVIGHAGDRIHFDQLRVFRRIENKVDAAPAICADSLEGRAGELLEKSAREAVEGMR